MEAVKIEKLKMLICSAIFLVGLTTMISCTASSAAEEKTAVPVSISEDFEVSEPVNTKTKSLKTVNLPENNDEDLNILREQIIAETGAYQGEWSVYVKNLKSGKSISLNSKPMYSASLIKLFALGAAYQKIEDGNLTESGVSKWLESMITVSSNDSFNSIERTIGLKYTTDWCQENGYTDTFAEHGLNPSSNSWGLYYYSNSGKNMTSVEDVGHFLENVYRGKCVSAEASEKMLEFLKAQQFIQKIPAGVPDGIVTANKTGETEESCHDAAIVFSYECDYILVVMTESETGKSWGHDSEIAELSKLVYNYFN